MLPGGDLWRRLTSSSIRGRMGGSQQALLGDRRPEWCGEADCCVQFLRRYGNDGTTEGSFAGSGRTVRLGSIPS
jgi:hypothetical protein